jgi:hypothetical protein
MRNKFFFLFLFLTCLGIGNAHAADGYTAIHVYQIDGSMTTIWLSRTPKLTTTADALNVATTDETLEFPLDNVSRYVFGEESDPTDNITNNTLKPYTQNGDEMIFSSLKAGSEVNVYTSNGSIVDTYKVSDNGTVSISLQKFSNGIYLIKTQSGTYKLVKK